MPNNAGKKISRIFGSCVFLLLSAQIVIGCAWGILNFTSFQEFPESAKMILLSSGLSLRSDTSVIYPALLLIVRTLTLNGPIKFYEVMYVLQLVLAFAAWYTFAARVLPIEKRWLRIWFALAVVTNPFAMQCHLAVLEFSFVSSFLCLLVTFTVRFSLEWKMLGSRFGLKTAVRHVCIASLFWMLVSLTRKEFVFIGFFCILFLLYKICVNLKAGTKLSRLSPAIVFIVFFAAIELIDGAFRASKPLLPSDVIKRSAYIRIAWTEDLANKYVWPEHIIYTAGEHMAGEAMADPGIVRTDFTDFMDEQCGRKQTSDYYVEWFLYSFKDNKKGIIKDALVDLAGYVFPPAENEAALSGRVLPGFATGNLDVMRRHTPLLTEFYLRLASIVYILFAIASAAALIIRKELVRRLRAFAPVWLIAVCSSVVYTFYGSNTWDHKKALFATCIWVGLFAALSVRGITGKEEA
ncbi:MAG: hypothetical protein J6W85_04880 [Lachnospiraceae bacterium]|nr:hypothetical protein [Lachnospiraceae bacterium]